jgi:hypothetical protein
MSGSQSARQLVMVGAVALDVIAIRIDDGGPVPAAFLCLHYDVVACRSLKGREFIDCGASTTDELPLQSVVPVARYLNDIG